MDDRRDFLKAMAGASVLTAPTQGSVAAVETMSKGQTA
ncbi:MAG TPA: twin-arginine translocation signal domain-containing protein [Blastocatellia bacterium]|nr:twin-arginine translocation signal domain-containing protein [Blastocatellia bacterium]